MIELDFEKPCQHHATQHENGQEHPDHHPLRREEVAELLTFMKLGAADAGLWSKAAVRLCQAIPGMTCPRPINGAVARKHLKLENLLVSKAEEGATPDLVSAIMALLR